MATIAENEIRNYIGLKEINGSLFLKGKWGSGKTYLINNIIGDEELKKEYHFVMCSFFGVCNKEDAEKTIKQTYLLSNGIVTKIEKKANGILEVGKKLIEKLEHGEIINSVLSINLLDFVEVEKEYGPNKKQTILIIDDIERSTIPTNELLGIINNYCENKKIKVIIIGNEIEIDDLEQFNRFKEKVVFRTVQIDNDYENVIDNIIDNYQCIEKEYVEFLKSNKKYIYESFIESETEDIRLLKSCLIDFERVYGLINKIGKFDKNRFGEVLYSFCVYKYEIGTNNTSEGDFGVLELKNEDNYSRIKHALILDSLVKWLRYGKWNEEDVKNEINDRFSNKRLSSEEKILRYHFWNLDSKTLDEGLPVLIEKGYRGELNSNELIRLLGVLSTLNELNVAINKDVDYKKIEAGWNIRENKIKSGLLVDAGISHFLEEKKLKELDKTALNLYRRLANFDIKTSSYENRLKAIELIKDPSKDTLITMRMKPISCFDKEMSDLFIKSYLKVDNSGKYDLSMLLKNIDLCYEEYSSKNDIETSINNLKYVCAQLNDAKKVIEGSFDKCVVSQTVNYIEKKISQLEQKQKQ